MTAIAELPGPRGLPGLANALRLRPDRMHVLLEQWGRRYGPVYRFAIGRRQFVAFTDAAAINDILRERPHGFRRWTEIQTVIDELGAVGVFTAEGDDWRRQRRLAVTALNTNHLHRYFDVVRVATARLRTRLEHAGTPVDIHALFRSYTVDVTSALAFGHDLNTLERGEDELQRHLTGLFALIGRRISAPVPYWHFVKPPADRAAEHSITVLRSAIEGFIADARTRMRERPQLREAPENFLESILAGQEEGRYSDEEVIGNVFTLLLAGEDTTANTLAWATFLLAGDRAAQQRLAAEADEILGEDRELASAAAASELRFGEGVLREAMRLKSTAPIIFVEALEDTSVAGVELPRGTHVLALTRLAGLPERNARFDPQRWLESHDSRTFLAFGAGPRFCPGRNLAFLEGKAALAMLARNFELELAGPPPRERLGFTMAPAGLRVTLRERKVPASRH